MTMNLSLPTGPAKLDSSAKRSGPEGSGPANFGSKAKKASIALGWSSTEQKNRFLKSYAQLLRENQALVLEANAHDRVKAVEQGISGAFLDRLTLSPARIEQIVQGLEQVMALPDPVGEVRECHNRPNGLKISKVGVPLGVVFFIYESRPNVTADAIALCVKSGNAVILRGGLEAFASNEILVALAGKALSATGMDPDLVQLVPPRPRELMDELLADAAHIDLVIPRGGRDLIERVVSRAKMPVMKHFTGNCHVYIEESASFAMARSILINAKCQRPGVCNAAESLLIDRKIAGSFLPGLIAALLEQGVEIRGCAQTQAVSPQVKPATEEDYATEYASLMISAKVVENMEEAIGHIARYGSGHTEAIVTASLEASRIFTARVDSSAVMVNASTRFNDGFELGLGAEIGISTDKFHARGPCGLKELTSTKYIVEGWGHVRE